MSKFVFSSLLQNRLQFDVVHVDTRTHTHTLPHAPTHYASDVIWGGVGGVVLVKEQKKKDGDWNQPLPTLTSYEQKSSNSQ